MKDIFVPTGHRLGMPEVTVWPQVVEAQGEPVANYEGLEDLYHGYFKIPLEDQVCLQLRPLSRGTLGRMARHGAMRIDPAQCYEEFDDYGLTPALLHEGQHLSDNIFRPVEQRIQRAKRIGSFAVAYLGGSILGMEAAQLTEITPRAFGAPGLGMLAAAINYRYIVSGYLYERSPREKRAYATDSDEDLIKKYNGVIDFPERPKPTTQIRRL